MFCLQDCVCPRGSSLLVTADRDHKLRASNLPRTVPLIEGSWDIQSFLFGHLAFVSCATAVPEPGGDATSKIERLASGGKFIFIHIWAI